jgi:Mrp family chromosome partitioning ATPase
MYEAINRGIAISLREVLARLNRNDLYLPWSVEVAVPAVQQPGVELIYRELGILRGERNRKPRRFNIQFKPDFNLRNYSIVPTICHAAVSWSRSLTERIGLFDTGYRPPVPAQRSRPRRPDRVDHVGYRWPGHEYLEEESDVVLIDLSPLPHVTDALVVAAVTGNVLLVIGPKANTRPALSSAREQIDRVGARIIGGVPDGPDPSLAQAHYAY